MLQKKDTIMSAQTKSLCYKKETLSFSAQTKSLWQNTRLVFCIKKETLSFSAQTKSLWQNTRLVFCINKRHYHLEMILYSKS